MYYGYIYKVTDKRNNLSYVGQHQGKFSPTYHGSGILIKPLVKRLGTDNFIVEPIAYVFSQDELDQQEIFWIKETNCIWPNGYNFASGGQGSGGGCKKQTIESNKKRSLTLKGHKPSQESNIRRSITLTGRKLPEEVKLKMRHPHREGWINPRKGKSITEEHRLNISKSKLLKPSRGMLGKHHSAETIEKIRQGVKNRLMGIITER